MPGIAVEALSVAGGLLRPGPGVVGAAGCWGDAGRRHARRPPNPSLWAAARTRGISTCIKAHGRAAAVGDSARGRRPGGSHGTEGPTAEMPLGPGRSPLHARRPRGAVRGAIWWGAPPAGRGAGRFRLLRRTRDLAPSSLASLPHLLPQSRPKVTPPLLAVADPVSAMGRRASPHARKLTCFLASAPLGLSFVPESEARPARSRRRGAASCAVRALRPVLSAPSCSALGTSEVHPW